MSDDVKTYLIDTNIFRYMSDNVPAAQPGEVTELTRKRQYKDNCLLFWSGIAKDAGEGKAILMISKEVEVELLVQKRKRKLQHLLMLLKSTISNYPLKSNMNYVISAILFEATSIGIY